MDPTLEEAPAAEQQPLEQQLPPTPAPAPAAAPPAKPNPYDDVIRDMDAAGEQPLRTSLANADTTTPDRAAAVQNLAQRTGLPAEVVDRNFEAIQKQATYRETPYRDMLRDTPATAAWATDPNNAKVAQDDMEKLGALEWIVTAPQRAVAQALNEQRYGALRMRSIFQPLTQEETDLMNSYKLHAADGGKLGAGDSWFKGAVTGGLKLLTLLAAPLPFAAAGAGTGAAIGSVVPGAGTAAGALAGAEYGYTAGLGLTAFQTEAGGAYDDYLAFKDETGRSLDPQIAKAAALATGAINAAAMTFGGGAIIGQGLEKLGGLATRDAIKTVLRVPTVRAALQDAMLTYGKQLTEGTALMVGMRAVHILSGELAKTASNSMAGTTIAHEKPADVGAQLLQAAKEGAQSFALVAGVGPALGMMRDISRAGDAQRTSALITAMGEGVKQSKTAERAPAAVQDLLERATKDGPIESVYAPLDTWRTYWQDRQVDPAKMAEHVTGDPEAYERAVAGDTDLKIPTARYATTIGATEHNAFFANELRLAPDEMNAREGKAFLEQQVAAAEERAKAEAPPPAPREQVRAQILERLEGAGVESGTAENYARLVESGIGTLAERAGLDPFEVYQRYGLDVKRPELPGATSEVPDAVGAGTEGAAPAAGEAAAEIPPAGRVQLPLEEVALAPQFAKLAPELQDLYRRGTEARTAGAGEPGDVPDNPVAQQLEAERQEAKAKAMRTLAGAPLVDNNTPEGETVGTHGTEPPEDRSAARARRDAGPGISESRPGSSELRPGNDIKRNPGESDQQLARRRDRYAANARSIRRIEHYNAVFDHVRAEAEKVAPGVDATRLRQEFDYRVGRWDADVEAYRESGKDPVDLLRAIAGLGGIDFGDEGYKGEIRLLREGSKFGTLAGVPNVFRKAGRGELANIGRGIDLVLTSLRQDPRFTYLETIDDLLDAMDDATRSGSLYEEGVYPGTDTLVHDLGINTDFAWWRDGWEDADARDSGDGDTSFDVSEFGQGLFDALHDALTPAEQNAAGAAGTPRDRVRAFLEKSGRVDQDALAHAMSEITRDAHEATKTPPSVAVSKEAAAAAADRWLAKHAGGDVLETGEVQPRLPGAGQVRELEVPTPELEAPFSLTSEVAKGSRGKQSTLFQPLHHGSPHDFERFSTQHIGSGEGAAAYGWGLYFAENREVAEGYHERLSGAPPLEELKLGTLRANEGNGFNYSRRAHVNDLENIRASLAEDLLLNEPELRTRDPRTMALMYLDKRIEDYKTEWPEGVNAARRLRSELEKPGAITTRFGKATGGVYTVDIPDEHIAKMLDYDAPIKDQPEPVKDLVRSILKEKKYLRAGDDGPRQLTTAFESYVRDELGMGDGNKGSSAYQMILVDAEKKAAAPLVAEKKALEAKQASYAGYSDAAMAVVMRAAPPEDFQRWQELDRQIEAINGEAAKNASLALKAAGVPGLRYLDAGSRDDGKGTRNVVVFDESIVKLTHKNGEAFTPAEREEFFQEKTPQRNTAERRGSIAFGPDRKFTINLFAKADLSTFLHETGHFFLEVMNDVAQHVAGVDEAQRTPEQQQLLADHATLMASLRGEGETGKLTREQHETFAKQFEAYLMEGTAPSLELRPAFSRFRAWLLGVYRSLKNLGAELTPEVRGVMDRMLAGDIAIAHAEQEGRLEPLFTTAESAGMTPAQFRLYADTVREAGDRARNELDGKLQADVRREQTATWKAQREDVRRQVAEAEHAKPVNRAIAAIRSGANPDGTPMVEGMATEPFKLSRQIIVDRYGEDRLKTLPKPYLYTREGGLDPDVVAERFGFSSGDAMLNAIAAAGNMTAAIERETDARMLAEHGSLLLDGTLPEKARLAAANDVRDHVVRAELAALSALRRQVDPFVKQANREGAARLAEHEAERDYERRWLEAEHKLQLAIAEGRKQAEIDPLRAEVRSLKAKARGGPALLRGALPSPALLKSAAEAQIGKTRVRDLQPAIYWSASRKAAQLAIEAAARQDFDTAIKQKSAELMALNVYRAAEEAVEDVDARVRRARAMAKPAARAQLGKAGQSILEQVDGILDRYQFAQVPGKTLAERASIAKFVEGMEAQGLPVDLPAEVLNDARRIHYSNISVDELRGVSDGLDELRHLAGLTNRLLAKQAKLTLDETATGLSTNIREKFTGTKPEVSRDRSEGRFGRLVDGFVASHVRLQDYLRELDGGVDGGPMTSAIMFRLNDAGADAATRKAKATEQLAKIFEDAYPGSEKSQLYIKDEIPSVGTSMSRMERLMVALNWGSDSNRDRVRRGEGWDDGQVQGILDALDPRDLKFVQAIFDHINSYWPEIEAKQKRVYGVAPEKIAAVPIKARAGELAGGYFPLKYDDRLNATAARNLDLEAGNLAKLASYNNATTARGFTKERLSNVKLPIRRDFGPIFEHVGEVIHDLTHHEALVDVGRILAHRDVQKAIYETQGDLAYKQIKSAIRDIALGTARAQSGFDQVLGQLRQGAAIVGIGWKLATPLLHLSGALPKAFERIGPEWVGKGLASWIRGPETVEGSGEWIRDNSETMANRWRTWNREMSEISNRVGVNTGRLSGWVDDALKATTFGVVDKQKIADSYFYLIGQAQRVADTVTFLGQYEKSRAAGESHERAVKIADTAVLDAFGGGQVKDLPQVMRGNDLMKVWTTFYGPFNSTFNLMRESTRRTRWMDPASVGRLGVDYMTLWIVPAMMGYGIRQALKPAPLHQKPEDKTEGLAAALAHANLSYLANMMVGTRETAGFLEGFKDYQGPAGASIFPDLGRLIAATSHSASKAAAGKPEEALDANFFRSLAETSGVILHYPAGQVYQTLAGLAAILEGKTDNPAALVEGPPPKNQQTK